MSGINFIIIYMKNMEEKNSHFREIILDLPEAKDLMQRKLDLVEKNRELYSDYEKIEKEMNKNNTEIQKVKDKAVPIIEEELKKHDLGEFEIFTQSLVEDGVLKVGVIDLVEEMKSKVKKMKEKNEGSLVYPVSDTDTPQSSGEDTPVVEGQ